MRIRDLGWKNGACQREKHMSVNCFSSGRHGCQGLGPSSHLQFAEALRREWVGGGEPAISRGKPLGQNSLLE